MRKSSAAAASRRPARAGDHQRERDHAGEHRQDVEAERQRAGLDDPAVPTEPVHDRDGVDEDVERPRARPQRQDEADRDHVEAAALEDVVDGRHDDRVDGALGERPRGQVDDRLPDVVDLGGGEPVADVADRAGHGEDQRRHRQHREERRLGGEPGDPVAHARPTVVTISRQIAAHPRHGALAEAADGCRSGRTWLYGNQTWTPSGDIRLGHQPGSAAGRSQRGHLGRGAGRGGHRHARPTVVEDLAALGARGRHRGGPRARMLANEHQPRADALRPLRQPDRRGRVPPVVALADGARGRATASQAAPVGPATRRRRTPTYAAPPASWPGRRPSRARLPDLDDVRRRAGAAGRRGDRQGVDAAAGLDDVRPRPAAGGREARCAGRHGHDREAGRLRRPGQRDRGAADVGRTASTRCTATSGSPPRR